MILTISLDEPVAARLRERAAERGMPPEQAVRDIVGRVLGPAAPDEDWPRQNERRGVLIRKKYRDGLTAEEEAELARLQAAAEALVEDSDKRMLALAEEFKRLAEALPDAPKP